MSVQELRAILAEVWEWISNWNPNFTYDDEWPATADKVRAVLKDNVSEDGEPLHELVQGSRDVALHIKRLWPDQAERLLTGPAADCVAFLNAHTSVQVGGKAPASFTYWLPALRVMEPETPDG